MFDLLLHPVRLRIIAMFRGRALTTSELCASLPDVSKATVYRQVSLLVEAGVLGVVGERRVHGAVERVYEVQEAKTVIGREDAASMSLDEHRQLFAVAMATLIAEFNAYLESDGADPLADAVGYRRGSVWLNRDELAELWEAVRRLLRKNAGNEPTADRRLHIVSPIVFPIEERPGRQPEGSD